MVSGWFVLVALVLGIAIGIFLFAAMSVARYEPPERDRRLLDPMRYDGERLNEPRTVC